MLKITILRCISEYNGMLNWYKLDRLLSQKNIPTEGKLISVLRDLEKDGFVIRHQEENPSMPFYSLTTLGKEYLEKCREQEE